MTLHSIFRNIIILSNLILFFSFSDKENRKEIKQEKIWQAPTWADTLINPLSNSVENLNNGKVIYHAHCVICHGENGRGDGESGFGLETPPRDFMESEIVNQSDGAMFWKISYGKGAMPEFASKLTKTKRWELLLYVRELQRKYAAKKDKRKFK